MSEGQFIISGGDVSTTIVIKVMLVADTQPLIDLHIREISNNMNKEKYQKQFCT